MRIKTLISMPLVVLLTLLVASCSKDDDDVIDSDPEGTITINMLDENNGKTLLGNSDLYIDKAYNFYGPSCSISSLGKKKGLGSMSEPVLNVLASKVAVEAGNGYQLFKRGTGHEFPSGKLALNISADYYNVYVVSQIRIVEEIIGATVKYMLMDVPDNGLPAYNSNIGTLDHFDSNKHEITLTLPTSDFEIETSFASSDYYTLGYEKIDNKLIVRLNNYKNSDVFGFYIRINNSYTYVYGTVI